MNDENLVPNADNPTPNTPGVQKPIPPQEPIKLSETDEGNVEFVRILEEVKLPDRKAEFRTAADTPTPPPQPKPEPVAEPLRPLDPTLQKPQTAQTDIPSVHTLAHDLQDVVRDSKMSLVQAAALEQTKKQEKENAAYATESRPTPRRSRRIYVFAILFVVAGLLTLLATLYVATRGPGSVSVPTEYPSLMFAEQTIPFAIDGLAGYQVKSQLASARNSLTMQIGAITRVIPTRNIPDPETAREYTQPLSAPEFLHAIDARAPETLTNTLQGEYFLGFHMLNGAVPLLVFTVGSYEHAFAGMLEWEGTMNASLTPFYSLIPQGRNTDGTIRSSDFEDAILRNYDVRILRDPNGEVRLLYAFPTRDILIIAENQNSFVEALSRLRAERRI